MKFPAFFSWMLLIPLVLSACAPGSASPAAPVATSGIIPTSPAATGTPELLPTPTAAGPQPQATSRGDKLSASAPASVKLGDGRPVLIEFFRFT